MVDILYLELCIKMATTGPKMVGAKHGFTIVLTHINIHMQYRVYHSNAMSTCTPESIASVLSYTHFVCVHPSEWILANEMGVTLVSLASFKMLTTNSCM